MRRALRLLLRKRPVYAFEFEGRRLDIGTKQDWLRANLILGLEEEPWRSTILGILEAETTPKAESFQKKLAEKLKAGRRRRS